MTENVKQSGFLVEIKRPATAIASLLAVISIVSGTVVSLYFYNKAQRYGEIIYTASQVQIFQKSPSKDVPLTVHDKGGNVITNNVYAASVTIWNGGNANVPKDDVREPFIIAVNSRSVKVLDISATFYSRNNSDRFSINPETGALTWQNFDPGEGLKVRVIYVDDQTERISLKGMQ